MMVMCMCYTCEISHSFVVNLLNTMHFSLKKTRCSGDLNTVFCVNMICRDYRELYLSLLGPAKSNLYRQVVFMRRWSLGQAQQYCNTNLAFGHI